MERVLWQERGEYCWQIMIEYVYPYSFSLWQYTCIPHINNVATGLQRFNSSARGVSILFLTFWLFYPPSDQIKRAGSSLQSREYWIIYRGPGCLAIVWFGSSRSLPSGSCLSLTVFLCIADQAYWRRGRGGRRAKSYNSENVWSTLAPSILSAFVLSLPPSRGGGGGGGGGVYLFIHVLHGYEHKTHR